MDAPDPDTAVQEPPPVEGKKRDLTSEDRRNIVSMLLLAVKPGDAEMNYSAASSSQFDNTSILASRLAYDENPIISLIIFIFILPQ